MIEFLKKYKGGIMFVLVTVVMFNMYTDRIAQLREIEQQQKTQVSYYEK